MGRLIDIVRKFEDELKQSPGEAALDEIGAPDIDTAHKLVREDFRLREEWADACLSLAEGIDWEPVEFKRGHRVLAGQHGWRIFCAQANLTTLRDQTYPALLDRRNLDRP